MIATLFSSPIAFLIVTLALVLAVTVHEFAHAWVADRLGDPTARLLGRVTLNPLAHLDPIGTVAILLVGFGWGKPVPFDPYNLDNPRRDGALIALAGPTSNIVIVFFLTMVFKLTGWTILAPIIFINLMLALFNLIPIHPLDGFKIVGGFLTDEQAESWYSLERYGMLFLIFILLPIFSMNGQSVSLVSFLLSPLLDNILQILLG